jgi:N-methylhydantoinase A/oxoprolinase/acetone carboxylase beta subunit
MPFMAPMTEQIVIDRDAFNGVVDELMGKARADLENEGLGHEEIVFSVELDMLYGGLVHVKRVSSPVLRIENEDDARRVYDAFEKEFSEAFSPHVVNKPGGAYVDGIVVKATVVTEKMALPVHDLQASDPSEARTGSRDAYWPELGKRAATDVFAFDALQPGNTVTGPGIVEMEFSTIVIPPGQQLRIDQHGLGILQDAGRDQS